MSFIDKMCVLSVIRDKVTIKSQVFCSERHSTSTSEIQSQQTHLCYRYELIQLRHKPASELIGRSTTAENTI